MPRWRVQEIHSYSLTFEVEAATKEEAEALANEMGADEGNNEEIGCDEVEVTLLDEEGDPDVGLPEEPTVCVTGMCVNDATCPRQLHCRRHACDCPEEGDHDA